MSSLFDHERNDIRVFIADCNNHCIRTVYYDVGVLETPKMKNVPQMGYEDIYQTKEELFSQEGERAVEERHILAKKPTSKTNDAMDLECDGDLCYPKW